MTFECPPGDGKHPVILVVIAANDLKASASFYSTLFGWTLQSLSPEITAATAPAGPAIALRANVPDGFQGVVPFLAVPSITSALQHVSAAGGSTEREPWSVPMVGMLARFRDGSGTIYGVSEALPLGPVPRVGMPFGDNPKPPAGAICSLEMYAKDGDSAAKFFGKRFGWGTNATMPQFMAFDPGAGIRWRLPVPHTERSRGGLYLLGKR